MSKRIAQVMFDADRQHRLLQSDVEDAILKVLGKDPDGNPDLWGFDDFTFDDYDSSFELKSCTESFVLTKEQIQAFADMGFQQCWICTKPAGVYDPGLHVWFVKH